MRSTPLAYIEYIKSMNGELKGITVSHQTIMSQCHSFTAATTDTVVFSSPAEDGSTTTSVLPNWDTQGADTLLTYIEPRQQIGLNISILCSIYSGSHTTVCPLSNRTLFELGGTFFENKMEHSTN